MTAKQFKGHVNYMTRSTSKPSLTVAVLGKLAAVFSQTLSA